MPGRGRAIVATGLLALCAFPCSAQTVRGLLLEEATELPIELGRVVLVSEAGDSLTAALTDEQGFFSLTARSGGRFILVASALGFRAARSERIDVDEGEVRVTQLHLTPRPIPVAGVDVTAAALDELEVPELAAHGFYERMDRGFGEFLTPGQIRAHSGKYTPQLFREMLIVALVSDTDRGAGPWSDQVRLLRDVGQSRAERMCEPMVWVDDVYVQLMPGESLDDLAPKGEIEGIEVHRAPFGAPLRYFRDNSQAACGAILIWTREGR